MPAILKDILKVLLFFGVGFTILYFVYASQNTAFQEQCRIDGIPESECSLLGKVWSDLQSVNWFWLLAVVACFNISNISRAYRWKMMVDSLGYQTKTSNAFFCIMIGYFANLGLPRAGEILRATVFAKYEKIRIDRLIGTIAMDRLIDMVSVLLVVGLAISIEFDLLWGFLSSQGGQSRGIPTWMFYAAGIGLAILLISYFFREALMRLGWVQKILNLLLGFWEGLQSIRTIKKPIPFILHSMNIWFMYFLMTYLCFFAFEPTSDLSARAGLIVFVFGTFGVIIPSPGGMGTFHALAVIALALYGISGDDAFSFANILFFTIQIGSSVLLGLIAVAFLPIMNRSYNPDRSSISTREITTDESPK